MSESTYSTVRQGEQSIDYFELLEQLVPSPRYWFLYYWDIGTVCGGFGHLEGKKAPSPITFFFEQIKISKYLPRFTAFAL